MHGFMATGAPARALAQAAGSAVIGAADDNSAGGLLLEVTPETKIGISGDEHLIVDRPVRIVAHSAALAYRFMLENEWPPLSGMALSAGVALRQQSGSTALYSGAFVRIVAVGAAYLTTQHRMAVCQLELPFLVQVTLKAGFRRALGIQDAVMRATGLIVNATGAVTGFAANVFCVWTLRLEAHMSGGFEIAGDLGMTLSASLRAHKFRARDLRWGDHGARHGRTRDQANGCN